jgi:hypothetical protein
LKRELRTTPESAAIERRKLAAAANLFCHAITREHQSRRDAEGTQKSH